jgi:O-antigen ligase/tetratricopeptide (TPR) repeat protein
MPSWWGQKNRGRERFLRLSLVPIYLFVPLVWAPGSETDSYRMAAFLALFVPTFAVWILEASDWSEWAGDLQVFVPLSLLFGASILSMFSASSWRLAVPALFWELTFSLFLLFLIDTNRRPGMTDLLSRVICVAAALVAAFGMFQFYDLFNIEESFGTRPFLPSTLGNPSLATNFVATALPAAASLMLMTDGWQGWAWGGLVSLCYAFLLAAQTRSSWLGLAFGVGFASVVLWRIPALRLPPGKARRALWFSVVLAIVTCLFATPSPLNRRLSPLARVQGTFVAGTEAFASRSERETTQYAAILMVRDHPILGVGIGNFPALSSEYLGRAQALLGAKAGVEIWWEPHNEYLQTLAELGPAGLLAFLCLTVSPFLLAVKRLPTLSLDKAYSLLGVSSGLIVFLVDSSLNYPRRNPANLLLFLFMLAATHTLSQSIREDNSQATVARKGFSTWTWTRVRMSILAEKFLGPTAVLCIAILAAGAGFTGGHIAGEILTARARAVLAMGDDREAGHVFLEAQHLAPFKWDIPVRLGAFYALSGRPREAVEALADAQRFVVEGTIVRTLAVAYGEMGDLEGARAAYRRALFFNPGDLAARAGLVASYRDNGDYTRAVTEAHLGLRLDSQNGHLQYLLGTSLAKLGQEDEAFGHLVVAMRLIEKDREIAKAVEEVATAVGRADTVERARRRLSAIEAVEQVTRLRRRSAVAALEWFSFAIQRDPDFGYPHFEQGRLYFLTGRKDLALQEFKTYLRKAPIGEVAREAAVYVRIIEHPSMLARVLGRDLRFDFGM